MASRLEDKTIDDICECLEDGGFPESVLRSFREQELDGKAIAVGLASSPGPDWLKDVVPTLGLRLKVHNAVRTMYSEWQPTSLCTPSPSQQHRDISPFSPGETGGPLSPTISTASVNAGSSSSASVMGSSSFRLTPKRKMDSLPKPFPIPKFRQKTETNLESKLLTDTDRRYIVQTLATMLMTYVQRPSLHQCGIVAQALVGKYPFIKDDEGDGEHSWKWFLYYRCQNVNRKSTHDGNTPKRRKVDCRAAHFCPPTHAEDEVSYARNEELLRVEMAKSKPRSDVLKELMRRTFPNRWDAYVNDNDPPTLLEYLAKFPLLKKPTYAALDFNLVCKEERIRDTYEEKFPLWATAIVTYCKDTQTNCSALQTETAEYSNDLRDDQTAVLALRCLALLFAPMKTKKLGESIPYILKIRGTPPEEAPEKTNNQPHIVIFQDEDEDSFMQQQCFVSVEQQLMIETSNIVAAIFFCVAAHYVFNLTYHRKSGDVWLFVQEKVLNLPSKPGVKRNPSSTSHFSGISRIFEAQKTSRIDEAENTTYSDES